MLCSFKYVCLVGSNYACKMRLCLKVVRAKERGAKSIRKRVTENFERVCSLNDRKRQDAK